MDELLKQLAESKLLTEGTIDTIRTQAQAMITEAVALKEAEVKATLTEQWITERELLVESLDAKLNDLVAAEVSELKDDIKSFRNLEVEFADKIESEKTILKEAYENDLGTLVETLNTFLENRLAIELQEFATDLEQVKKNEFAMQLYETFAPMFQDRFINEDDNYAKLQETQVKLDEAKQALVKTQKLQESAERKSKMTELLSTLSDDHQRNVMTTLLEGVATPELDTAYGKYIGTVIERATNKTQPKTEPKIALVTEGTIVVKGNAAPVVIQQATQTQPLDQAERAHLRKLAGLV